MHGSRPYAAGGRSGRAVWCITATAALILWGKNDKIFPAEGAAPYLRDLPDAELHLLDTGHFALEDKLDEMGPAIHAFLDRVIPRS